MTVLLAVTAVGAASLFFRIAPLLGAELLPERLVRLAAHAGLAVLTGLAVRAVVLHQDPAVTAVPGPVLAAAALAPALYLAFRGRSTLLAISTAAAAYLLLATVLAGGVPV
jgi:branched-subunit amino acid transport protein